MNSVLLLHYVSVLLKLQDVVKSPSAQRTQGFFSSGKGSLPSCFLFGSTGCHKWRTLSRLPGDEEFSIENSVPMPFLLNPIFFFPAKNRNILALSLFLVPFSLASLALSLIRFFCVLLFSLHSRAVIYQGTLIDLASFYSKYTNLSPFAMRRGFLGQCRYECLLSLLLLN